MTCTEVGVNVISDDDTEIRRGDTYECTSEDCNTKVVTDFGKAMTVHSLGPESFRRMLSNCKGYHDLVASW